MFKKEKLYFIYYVLYRDIGGMRKNINNISIISNE